MGKKLPEVHVSGGITYSSDVVSSETGPRPWRPPKPLKELLREDRRPENEVYRRLIRAWPDITESRLREIIQTVDKERLNKVLDLCELTKKHPNFFEEFLGADCNYKIFDRVYCFWRHVLPKVKDSIERLDESLAVDWTFNIDQKPYSARLYCLVDGAQKKLELFANRFGKPVIGLRYKNMPCFSNLKTRIEVVKAMITNALQNDADPTEAVFQLQELATRHASLQNDYLRFNAEGFIGFPVKYTYELGLLRKKHVFASHFTIPCSICKKQHEISLIATLEPRRGGEHG